MEVSAWFRFSFFLSVLFDTVIDNFQSISNEKFSIRHDKDYPCFFAISQSLLSGGEGERRGIRIDAPWNFRVHNIFFFFPSSNSPLFANVLVICSDVNNAILESILILPCYYLIFEVEKCYPRSYAQSQLVRPFRLDGKQTKKGLFRIGKEFETFASVCRCGWYVGVGLHRNVKSLVRVYARKGRSFLVKDARADLRITSIST